MRFPIIRSVVVAGLSSVLVLTGCGAKLPGTSAFSAYSEVSAMVAETGGGLQFSDTSGTLWGLDSKGVISPDRLANIEAPGNGKGALGLAIDDKKRTFASWLNSNNALVVGQIYPGPIRRIWTSPQTVTAQDLDSSMAFTPTGRLAVSVPAKALDATGDSKLDSIITLDADADASQQPNVVSSGWTDLQSVVYDQGGSLWVVANDASGTTRLGRAGDKGFVGTVTKVGKTADVTSLVRFGDKELVMCSQRTGELRRYLIQTSEAISGRLVAKNCTTAAVELSDGRVAYVTTAGMRVTEQ